MGIRGSWKRLFAGVVAVVVYVSLCNGSSNLLAENKVDDLTYQNALKYTQHAEFYMREGRTVEAVEAYKTAIRLSPEVGYSANLYHNLGQAYASLKRYPEAIVSYQRAIRLQPGFQLYYQHLVDVYETTGQVEKAINALEAVVAYNPQDGEAYFLLGLLYKVADNPEASQAVMQRYQQLNPFAPMTMEKMMEKQKTN